MDQENDNLYDKYLHNDPDFTVNSRLGNGLDQIVHGNYPRGDTKQYIVEVSKSPTKRIWWAESKLIKTKIVTTKVKQVIINITTY